MRDFSVRDIGIDDVITCPHDLAIFASGYEERCTHVPTLLKKSSLGQWLILAFEGMSESLQRRRNDKYFDVHWSKKRIRLSANSADGLLSALRRQKAVSNGTLRIVIDYSSMSRLWYAALLNWARVTTGFEAIEIDLLYSIGTYPKTQSDLVVDDILTMPGLEGGALRFDRSVAVFGLGFFGTMTHCVLENLGPDDIYAYLASPGASPRYRQKVRNENRFVIENAKATLEVPLDSVETTYRYLTEMVTPHLLGAEVVIVPMGPKPHVLAAIAMR